MNGINEKEKELGRALNGCLAGLLVCMVFFALPVKASVTGKVSDTSGDPVVGATVTFIQEDYPENNISGITGLDGLYSIDITVGVEEDASDMPQVFSLGHNYPNPFNPTTIIPFSLEESGNVRLDIYNIMGQHVRTVIDGYYNIGSHMVVWDAFDNNGNHLGAGIYLYRLSAAGATVSKKMLLIDGGGNSGTSGSVSHTYSHGDALAKSAINADNTTYLVMITGEDIVTLKESGVIVKEGEPLDFVVKRLPEGLPEGLKLVSIPGGGTFRMGDISGDGNNDERPVHSVTLSSFEMGIYEVTQEQYEDVMGNNPSNFSGTNLPVEVVSWYDAVEFCNALSDAAVLDRCYNESTWECDFNANGFRLPTEAEWEYACRAGTETKYYTGNNEHDLAESGWYSGNSGGKTHSVGQKTANAFGLYDMHGNVWEWCNDWYYSDYYSISPSTNPTGPTSGTNRIIRGGNWGFSAARSRSARRGRFSPAYTDGVFGFRVVCKL